MSYFWIFLYIVFVVFVIAFFSWSTIILQRQKKAWQEFAKKYELTYYKTRFFQAAAVEGSYKGFRIGLFSEGQVDESRRGFVRYRTVIELIFGQGMPWRGAFGNAEAVGVVQRLGFGSIYTPQDFTDWDKHHLITIEDTDFLEEYLTPERQKALNGFLNMNNATAMFVFDRNETFLRLETTNPLAELEKVERIMDKLAALGDVLKLTKVEKQRYKKIRPEPPPPQDYDYNAGEEESLPDESQ